MMKLSRVIPMVLILGGISALALSCAPKQSATSTTQSQVVTVQRGDLSIDITAVGNLALSLKEELAFEIPGTVEEVLVVEGDSVEEGQVLARLDTSEWEKQLTALKRQVTTAERQVTSAQKQLRDKKTAVVTAENQVTSKEYALRQAELDVQTANDTLEQITDVKKVQDKIDDADYTIKVAKGVLSGNFSIGMPLTIDNYWTNLLQLAQSQLAQFQKEKQDLLSGTSLTVSSNVLLDVAKKQLAVEQKQLGITQAQLDLDNAKQAVEDARSAIAPAQQDLQNAQDDLGSAQEALDEAKSKSPEIKAPFVGFITKVNIEGGDEVKKGTVAVQIADPTKFEAEVLVNETDISQVKLDGTASVELQAIPGVSLSAKVTHIAPTATIQQGVVNYKVTVEIESLQPVMPVEQQTGANVTSSNFSSATPFGRGAPVSGSGNLTQEQINQRRQQRQQAAGGQFGRIGAGLGSANLTQEQISQIAQQRQQALAGRTGGQAQIPAGQPGRQSQTPAGQSSRQSRATAAATTNIRLAEGMTVTVTLPVESRTNVVLVPNGAITTKGGQASIKVISSTGAPEERLIQTGISNWQYTEATSGLSEGEKVVITKTTTTTTTTTPRQRQQTPPVRIPGIGGFGR